MEDINELTPLHTYTPMPGGMETHRESFKRALLRPPPSQFMIEFLPLSNKGSHNHGMRISPYEGDSGSVFTRSKNWEYEIWRKWEDILWFQQALEAGYSRAAREKRVRLAQGKGVKAFNGFYKQDMASSFESLPPGPLPSSVAQDIHEYLPRLTKKGTLFRASQATLEQRQKEFRALVEALFSDDVPSLIRELRVTQRVTDFFGLWRRDYDCMEKAPKTIRNSVTSSVFSSYFSESLPALNTSAKCISSSPETSPTKTSSRKRSSNGRPRSTGSSSTGSTITSSATQISEVPCQHSPSLRSDSIKRLSGSSDEGSTLPPGVRPRALSNTSSDTCSTHSEEACIEVGPVPTIVGEGPITFDHNPILPVERSSVLEVLPEERELLATSPESYFESPQKCKTDNPISDRKANRTWQVVGTPAAKATFDEAKTIRESWQTTTSIDSGADAILDGIGFTLPDSIKEERVRASLASIMTTNSAEAVLPREDTTFPLDELPRPVSMSVFDIDSDDDEDSASIVNGIPFPSVGLDEKPETPTQELTLSVPTTPMTTSTKSRDSGSSFGCPPSPTASEFSMATTTLTTLTTSTVSGTSLSIKAAHNSSIIMLRAQRDTSFEDIRQRLYNKFVGQEGIPLSNDFAVAMVVPLPTSPSPEETEQNRHSSLSLSLADKSELHFIDTQYDWEQVVLVRDSNKVALRILDAPRS